MKNFKLILKSLFSNNATVEGARHRPWYFALIIFFVSMILAVVPIFTTAISKHGSDIVEKNSYNMDNFSLRLTEAINEKDVPLEVTYSDVLESNVLTDHGKWNDAFNDHVYSYGLKDYSYYVHQNESAVDDFWAFYVGNMDSTTLSNFLTDIENKLKEAEKPVPSMVIMSERQIAIYFCNVNDKSTIGSVIGDYKSSEVGFTLNSLLSQKDKSTAEGYAAYRAETWDNWKKFYDDIYNHNRKTSAWATTGIMIAINTVLVFFMGLMVFVLTRGKNNPFRIYTFWESMKVSMWAGDMPALLTCGLGFLLTSFAQVLFALLLGVRVMWLTMKTLGPNNVPTQVQNNKVKTVNAKPVR